MTAVLRPFEAFFGMLTRMHALTRAYETPAATFAARGTTRDAEVRRLMGL